MKKQLSIRIDVGTLEMFKGLSESYGLTYEEMLEELIKAKVLYEKFINQGKQIDKIYEGVMLLVKANKELPTDEKGMNVFVNNKSRFENYINEKIER